VSEKLPPLFDGDPDLPTVLRAGYTVGNRYTLGQPLGHGGYGSLWTAVDERTGEEVAVKVLQAVPDDSSFSDAAARLRREGRAYQRLSHPAVTRLRNIGTTDQGEPYIVMELLRGKDLAKTLGAEGKMAPEQAVEILLPIAEALAEAHEDDLVHRDVKLGNIFLAEQDDGTITPKLIDFGLTKDLDAIASAKLTAAGVRIGSPSYMSPEQARGREVDIRSDVWSFCVVLYRMVTGRLPFLGTSHVAQRVAIIDEPVPTFAEVGAGEPELWEIVACGLEKAPEKRWQSMRALGEALRAWLAKR
jgi:serine/threonine-protein kinase